MIKTSYDLEFLRDDGKWCESALSPVRAETLDAACEIMRDVARTNRLAYRLLQNGIILYTYDPADDMNRKLHSKAPPERPASVLAEATLAAAVKVDPPREFPPRQADGTINPKDAAALKRVPMHLLPQVGVVYGAMACRDGAIKYGPYNWRERSISLVQYVGAMQRHLSALLDGEDCASDSGLPHLAHVIATAAILLDAKEAGALLDDRPKRSGNTAALIAALNAKLAEVAQ